MSIFKDSFKQGIKDQLKVRQDAINTRSPQNLTYMNSRNAWIKMTSSVNVGGTADLAVKYILQGGILFNNNLRSGLGANGAYNNVSPNGQNYGQMGNSRSSTAGAGGIRPMPGITDISVKSKGAYGSLREVTVNFQCWDIHQLEDLELLYMRPGYSALVEWGWSPYLDNNNSLIYNVDTSQVNILGNNGGKKTKEEVWKAIFTKSSENGNYDSVYGIIKNYGWSARPDGGYDCHTTLITMGEILESLKINHGDFTSKISTEGIFGKLTTPFASDSNIAKSYSQNALAGAVNELYLIMKDNEAIDNLTGKSFTFNSETYNFFRFDVTVDNAKSEDSDFDHDAQIYITLKDLIKLLNNHIILHDGGTPIVEVSVTEGMHMGTPGADLLCLGHPLQLSTDPTVCLIKNLAWKDPGSLGFAAGFTDDFSTIKGIMEGIPPEYDYWYNKDYTKTQLGVIGNIYVNLGYIYSLVTSDNLASKDSKEKNDIALFDFLKNMMSGISTAIGNVATFEIFVDPQDSIARIIDVNYADSTKRSDAYTNAAIIEMQNTKSTVRSYKLESQIFPDQTTTIAIGAQVKGGALGSNTNTLVDFNQNLIDRIIPVKELPSVQSTSNPDADLKEQVKNLKDNVALIVSFLNQIDADWYEYFRGAGDFDTDNASKYANALKDIINFFTSLTKNDNKNRGIIPTKLSIEMDGIGGLVIGNLFRIPDDLLPRGYKGGGAGPSKIGYIITGIGHSIQNNDWKTNIDAQFIILDEPIGGLSLSDLVTIQALIRTVSARVEKVLEEVITDIKTILSIKGKTSTKRNGGSTTVCNGASTATVDQVYPRSVSFYGNAPVIIQFKANGIPNVTVKLSQQPEVKYSKTIVTPQDYILAAEKVITKIIPGASKENKKQVLISAFAISRSEQGYGKGFKGFNNNLSGVESSGFSVFSTSDVVGKVKLTEGGTGKVKYYYAFSNLSAGLTPLISSIVKRNMFATKGNPGEWTWRYYRDWNGYGARTKTTFKSDCDVVESLLSIYKAAETQVNKYSVYR